MFKNQETQLSGEVLHTIYVPLKSSINPSVQSNVMQLCDTYNENAYFKYHLLQKSPKAIVMDLQNVSSFCPKFEIFISAHFLMVSNKKLGQIWLF